MSGRSEKYASPGLAFAGSTKIQQRRAPETSPDHEPDNSEPRSIYLPSLDGSHNSASDRRMAFNYDYPVQLKPESCFSIFRIINVGHRCKPKLLVALHSLVRFGRGRDNIQFSPRIVARFSAIRPRQHIRRNREPDLFGRFQIDDELAGCSTGRSGPLSLDLCACCRTMTMTLTVFPQTLSRFCLARGAPFINRAEARRK
jgi:hypothetical protein